MRARGRLAVFVTCLLAAPQATGEERSLNCRDGGGSPPRLLLVQNLWGLRAYPAADAEWPDERKVREIAAAGFDAFDVWVGGAKEEDLARWKALGAAHGLGVGVEFGPERAEDADAAIAAAKRLGSVYLDAHVASSFTPEKEAEALLRALVERCRAAEHAPRHPDAPRARHPGPAAHGGLRPGDPRPALRPRPLPLLRGRRDGRAPLARGRGGDRGAPGAGDDAGRSHLERRAGAGGPPEPRLPGAHGDGRPRSGSAS